MNQFKGDELSARRAFLKTQVAWRSRVRGTAEVKAAFVERFTSTEGGKGLTVDSESQDDVLSENGAISESPIVAQRIYLPNIQIRLVRNHVPPGEAYDPMIATFRIPQSMTKTDLRSYLSAVYNLPVTFIRTANYLAPVQRGRGGQIRRKGGMMNNYKKAVVGLLEPFHYPDDVDELRAMEDGERLVSIRQDWLDENYRIREAAQYRKKILMKYYKGYRWRTGQHDNSVSFAFRSLDLLLFGHLANMIFISRVIPSVILWKRESRRRKRSHWRLHDYGLKAWSLMHSHMYALPPAQPFCLYDGFHL